MKQRTKWQWARLFIVWKLGLILTLVFVIFSYVMFQTTMRQNRLKSIQATILTSRLKECSDGTFSVDIRFAYTIDRQRFTTGKYRDDFGELCLRKEKAQAILKDFPQGEQVEAWYDPDHPKYAVLDHSLGTAQQVMIVVLISFVFLSVIVIARVLRRRRQDFREGTKA